MTVFYVALLSSSELTHYSFLAIDPASINLALYKTTWQSGVSGGYSSSNAADGDFDPNGDITPPARTERVDIPWWGVDLQAVYRVAEVKVVVSSRYRRFIAHLAPAKWWQNYWR